MNYILPKIIQKLILTFIFSIVMPTAHAEGFAFTPLVGFRTSDSLEEEVTEEVIDIDETSSFGFIKKG